MIEGLMWYLKARDFAYDQLTNIPHGASEFEVRLPHDIYFNYAISAIKLICDKTENRITNFFLDGISSQLGSLKDYEYAKALRNAIVHEGINPTAMGHSTGNILLVRLPKKILPKARLNKPLQSSFDFTIQLAAAISDATNHSLENLYKQGHLDKFFQISTKIDILNAINDNENIPSWVKAMSADGLDQIDLETMYKQTRQKFGSIIANRFMTREFSI